MAKASEDLVALTDWQIQVRYYEIALLIATVSAAIWAALAATNSVRVARQTAQQELRAYIGVADVVMRGHDTRGAHPATAIITLKNFGQTPAYNVEYQSFAQLRPMPDPNGFAFETWRPRNAMSHGIINPGTEFEITAETTGAVFRSLSEYNRMVYLFGEIRYRDAFKKKRFTRWRFGLGGIEGPNGPLRPSHEGNEAN